MFIKLESHGLGKSDVVGHAGGLVESKKKQAAGKVAKGLKKIGLGKIGGDKAIKKLEKKAGEQDAPDTRRERTPQKLIEKYEQVLLGTGSPLKKSNIDQKAMKAYGIQRMLSKLDSAASHKKGSKSWKKEVAELARKIRREYDHTNIRFGREVILTPEELR